ncbi:hypothetical protein J2046_001555 [Rhizobium petrolearium]|uniref:hypothetical protein n=1 Tax=Neorhizobium petrolearium TaxID=515361 RepID=UPI001AE2F0D4|nr:hypothetical protein [Neorhizobium petrolearium]MBP1843301.1 hypothetical protein [Neorhizobium petrolearium]
MHIEDFGMQLRRFIMSRLVFWLLVAMVLMVLAILLLLPSQQYGFRNQESDSIMWPDKRGELQR